MNHDSYGTPLADRLISKAILCREVEEKLLQLFSQGKLNGTVHTCIGQEFSAAVLSEVIRPEDSVFSNHRCHGHYLSITGDIKGLIGEIMGKPSGICGGIGGSQHLYNNNFYSNGIQGGIVPVAAGLALARKVRGQGDISVCMIGDGTLGEGAVYETFNLAAKWRLPLMVILENNGYAQSTSQEETLSGDILNRAAAFGIKTMQGNTWDYMGLFEILKDASEHCRTESEPVFVQVDTFRLKAHSKGDDDRPKELIQAYLERDPLHQILANHLPAREVQASIRSKIEQIVSQLEDEPIQVAVPVSQKAPPSLEWSSHELPKIRMVQRLQEVFAQSMAQHDKMYFWGEDVKSPYGGAFKVAVGLSDKFPDRVFNTPISEGAIAGLATGMALEGFRPFVEFMFGDFTTLAFDQILNHAAKFQSMYASASSKVKTNVVFRTPMGGKRCYGPTHSQTLDKHFLGIPGLKTIALSGLVDPALIFQETLRHDHGPIFQIENKILYTEFLKSQWPEGFTALISSEPFPTVYIKPQCPKVDITLLTYGGMASVALSALDALFEEHDIIGQLICPTQIYPFDVRAYSREIGYAPRLLTIEEGQGFSGFGAEVLAQMMSTPALATLSCRRLYAEPSVIPSAKHLEQTVLPDITQIVDAAKALVQET